MNEWINEWMNEWMCQIIVEWLNEKCINEWITE